ncbi:hypothetical protein AVEN_38409-1 [Araneus ventricosus]|uniref:Uncharacterized protein n=1 Tax=Araneus ventricosus TaxID=182803 RepID=A0A4Y2HC78_ARAVE|nr:hypothetical protein AVEN_38409-1 [Araneus ventricosus]
MAAQNTEPRLPPRNAEGFYPSVAVIAFTSEGDRCTVTNGPSIDFFDVKKGWLKNFKKDYIERKGIEFLLVRAINNVDKLNYLKKNLPDIYVGDLELGMPRFYFEDETSLNLFDLPFQAISWFKEIFFGILQLLRYIHDHV